MRKELLLILVCRMLTMQAAGQSTIGLPAIRNYTHNDYHAAIETWDAGQDKHNVLYFANNDGLLTFDGAYWKLFPLPNKAAIKSLAIDDSGRIYVGGQDEVGYFAPGLNGMLIYHSLKKLLPPVARQFADIWNIVILRNAVYFRTIESIFELKSDKMQTYDAPGGWLLLAKAGDRLYADDKVKGLLVFNNGQWTPPAGEVPGGGPLHITGIMDYAPDSLLVATLKNGLYLLHGSTLSKKTTAIDNLLTNDLVNTAQRIGQDRYVLGTNTGGAAIIDHAGGLIQWLSNNEGLQNNNVLAIFSDRDQNLWLGLKNGIACINYNTAVSHIYPVKGNQVLCNAVRVFDQRLFVGTSNGLYSVRIDPARSDISRGKGLFTEVANSKGQVWSLWEANHELLCGHQDGAFVVRNGQAIPLLTRQGAWGFVFLHSSDDIIAGTYTGLQRIHYENGIFREAGRASALYESLSGLAIDGHMADGYHAVWASHPYRGVFKIPVSVNGEPVPPYTHYTQKEGLPSDLNNFVYRIRNKIVVATEKGVYEYSAAAGKFMPSSFFEPFFRGKSVEYLTEDQYGNIWFVSDRQVGVIDFGKVSRQSPYSVIYFPELNGQTVKGNAFVYPYDDENIFIGGNNCLYHLNYSRYIQSDTGVTVLLSAVKAIAQRDSLVFGGYAPTGQAAPEFANRWSSFHFEYSSPVYARENNVEFSYMLEGFDKAWSGWSSRTEKDYTNLPYGSYTFHVRARNNLGNASAPVEYRFSIAPAWYQTIWALLFYLTVVLLAIRVVVKKQQRRFALHQKRHEEEQERLNYLHSLELDRKEKGIIALQKAKLEAELEFKNKELATVTMNLVERGGLLLTIKEELLAVIKRLNIPNLTYEFRSVFRMMSDTEKKDDDWNRFAIHFDEVHNSFLSTLKTKFPSLTSTDLKLCAYLRLNLTSKEIAQLLNISLKGVEVSRYRIRKKLGIPTETNLYDFLIDVTGQAGQA